MISVVLMLKACVLGAVQGITEFLPVSSSAHVVLLSSLLGDLGKNSKPMMVFLQGVSILAVIRMYRSILRDAISKRSKRNLLLSTLLGVLPFMIIGFLTHKFVVSYLFSPRLVSLFLFVGGLILIGADYFCRRSSDYELKSLDHINLKNGLSVGLFQLLAIFPGVSRSGSTIIGGLCIGTSRPVAVQFSFILAIPLLLAVSIFQGIKLVDLLSFDEWVIVAIASLVTFMVSCLVVRSLVDFLIHGRRSFLLIGIYRITLGLCILFLEYYL